MRLYPHDQYFTLEGPLATLLLMYSVCVIYVVLQKLYHYVKGMIIAFLVICSGKSC